jgi:hypothetical protein
MENKENLENKIGKIEDKSVYCEYCNNKIKEEIFHGPHCSNNYCSEQCYNWDINSEN